MTTDITIKRTDFASGKTRLSARYPDGEVVRWFNFMSGPNGLTRIDIDPHRFPRLHERKVRKEARRLYKMARRFWLDRQTVETTTYG